MSNPTIGMFVGDEEIERRRRRQTSATNTETAVEKARPLKLPVRLDLEAYSDAVIHDANWRRIAAFPKTELGTAMAQQVTDALNQSAAVDALKKAAAWLADTASLHSWAHVESGECACKDCAINAVGAALAQLEELRKGEV